MEQTKSDIINTAADLFKKYGLRSVSIDDVCKELRISKKTFYNYFKQKEQLIEEVLCYFHEENKKKNKMPCLEMGEGRNIINFLVDYDKTFKTLLEQNKKYFSLYYDLEKYYPLILRRRLESTRQDREDMIKSVILKGLEEKIFREDIDVDLMVEYVAMQFQTILNLPDKKNSDLFQRFRFFKDLLIRILANEKGMDYYLKNYYENK